MSSPVKASVPWRFFAHERAFQQHPSMTSFGAPAAVPAAPAAGTPFAAWSATTSDSGTPVCLR
jgi:hypothetical protein